MITEEDLKKFDVNFKENQKVYELDNFPNFPDDTKESKKVFNHMEIMNFMSKNIEFPIKVDILERIKDIRYKDITCFTLRDLFDIIKLDSSKFVNTNTFFKIHLEYKNKICVFKIIYYTICDDGMNTIKNTNELLETTKTHFRKKKFIKKFVESKKMKNQFCPNYLEYIPLIPLSWLEYDDNNELNYIDYFQMTEDNEDYPF